MKFNIKVPFNDGLHARPASDLVKLANGFKSKITASCGEKNKNLKSIIEIMSLGLTFGDVVGIEISGEDETEAACSIKNFFGEKCDE